MKNSKCSAVQFSQSKQEYNRHYFSTSTCTSKLPSSEEKKVEVYFLCSRV